MIEYYATLTKDIKLPGKPDRRKALIGFNKEFLPKGTRLHIFQRDAMEEYGNRPQYEGHTLVEISLASRFSEYKSLLISPSGNLLGKNEVAKEMYQNMEKDTSLEMVLKCDYGGASLIDIIQTMMTDFDIPMGTMLAIAHQLNEKSKIEAREINRKALEK